MKNSVKAHLVCLLQTLPMYLPLQAQLRHNQPGKWSAAPSEPAVLSSMASIDSNLESLYQELDAAEEALRLQGDSAPVSLDSPTEESSEDQIRESWFAVLDTLDVKAMEGWRRQRETLKDSVVAAIEALQWVSPSQVVVPTKLIQRAQQAINWHLEPNSPDEHEATMVELSKIGWPDGPILVESEPVRLKDRLDALPDAAAIELATGYRLPSSAVVAIQKLMTDYAERRVRVGLSAPSVMPVPVCWLKHGPYEGDEPLSVVFEDPKDPDCFSALGYIVEPALTGVKTAETPDGGETDQEGYVTSETLRLHGENAELLKQIENYETALADALEFLAKDPEWVVNDLGELGVKVNGRFFFLYKGYSLEYGKETGQQKDGVALHDDDTPLLYRMVGKVEFGETCWPVQWVTRGFREDRYTQDLKFEPGLSDGKPEDALWKPLPSAPSCIPAVTTPTGTDTEKALGSRLADAINTGLSIIARTRAFLATQDSEDQTKRRRS